MAEVVTVQGVSRRFTAGGRTVNAVHGATLSIDDGELLVLLGRSGSGKTTLLSMIGGLDRPDEGTVIVDGADVGSLRGSDLDRFRQKTVGWVFQTSGLLPLLTAAENVGLALRIQGRNEDESSRAALSALEEVGLAERADHRTYELSGGEQQRVALARALVKEPRVLLADEPTGQLDTETAASVMGLIREASAAGITSIVATHDPALADQADRVLVMEDGVPVLRLR
jgi:putative ABC transport system ATP-binding protein